MSRSNPRFRIVPTITFMTLDGWDSQEGDAQFLDNREEVEALLKAAPTVLVAEYRYRVYDTQGSLFAETLAEPMTEAQWDAATGAASDDSSLEAEKLIAAATLANDGDWLMH